VLEVINKIIASAPHLLARENFSALFGEGKQIFSAIWQAGKISRKILYYKAFDI